MSFADELRNAPEQERRKARQQLEYDWNVLTDQWYKDIKNHCMERAKTNGTSYRDQFSSFVGRSENSLRRWNGAWWERIEDKIKCRLDPNPKQPGPIVACLQEADMERVCADLSARLKKDGLNIDIQKIEKRKYQYELVWEEKKAAEKIITGILNLRCPRMKSPARADMCIAGRETNLDVIWRLR